MKGGIKPMAENNTTQNKYVSPSRLSLFLDNLKSIFSPLVHTHKISDISDYVVDDALSSTSNNPVANKAIDAEFDAIGDAMGALELAIDGKADSDHNHDDAYDAKGSAETALNTSKEYTDTKIASMVFIGTYDEYQAAYADGQIPINTFVILTDDGAGSGSGEDATTEETTAKLGYAVLGKMVLG